MTPVPTHAGGPFYVWYVSVYGYGPPATVDSDASRYLAWQQGVPKSLAALIPYGAMGAPGQWIAGGAVASIPVAAPPPPPPPAPTLAAAGGALLPSAPGQPAPVAVLEAPPTITAGPIATTASVSGTFEATAYGPPWDAENGTGVTSTGVDLRDAPHKYIIAVDPNVIPMHTKVRISPNPFGDDSIVFSAEDTGGAIKGNHVDIYDWRGRTSQLSWGVRTVTVTSTSDAVTSAPSSSASVYFNPLGHASVTPERIDQGVDYAGTGYLVAIADGVITASVANGSGWEGEGYIEYKITQAGPFNGAYIYYAEGVDTVVSVGEKVRGGARLCDLRVPMPDGIEIGWAAGTGEESYYRYHDGDYVEGTATRPGIAFSNLIEALGGPGGKIEGDIVGNFPEYMPGGVVPGSVTKAGGTPNAIAGFTPAQGASGVAADFTWPQLYYSAFVQLQRGIGAGASHANSADDYSAGITYLTMAS